MLQFEPTLDLDIADEDSLHKTTLLSKLNRLYRGNMSLYDQKDKVVNLSLHKLTTKQKKVLNLGLNCHLEKKTGLDYKGNGTRTPIPCYRQIGKGKKIEISEGFATALKNEGHNHRSCIKKSLLSKEHQDAITELKNNRDVII